MQNNVEIKHMIPFKTQQMPSMLSKKSTSIILLCVVFTSVCIYGQDSISIHHGFNIAIKNFGLSFGNSPGINGLRINIQDKNLQKVNGLNLTFWQPAKNSNSNSFINGIVSGIVPYAETINGLGLGFGITGGQLNGIHIGILGIGTDEGINGIGIGGLGIGCDGDVNGVLIGGLGGGVDGNIKGLGFGLLGLGCDGDAKGLLIGGLGVGLDGNVKGLFIGGLGGGIDKKLTGVGIAGLGIGAGEEIKGMGISLGKIQTKTFKGLGICSYSKFDNLFGISISIFNRIKSLKGIELGLINYAGNNRKLFRVLPILNMHFN